MTSEQEDIVAARERLQAWADANGDEIVYESNDYVIHQSSRILDGFKYEENNSTMIVVMISIVVASSLLTVLLIVKRK